MNSFKRNSNNLFFDKFGSVENINRRGVIKQIIPKPFFILAPQSGTAKK